jgi:hypothetical protein
MHHRIAAYLFFTVFTPQMPLLHAPTWTPEGKPPILLAAMRAAGALYVRNNRAAAFIMATLERAREVLVAEFAKDPANSLDRAHLILATAILQAVGLFHQKPEVRAGHSIFHGMLVQVRSPSRAREYRHSQYACRWCGDEG